MVQIFERGTVATQLLGEITGECHFEKRMEGQASSLSIRDDGHRSRRPTENLGFDGATDRFALLAMTVFSHQQMMNSG